MADDPLMDAQLPAVANSLPPATVQRAKKKPYITLHSTASNTSGFQIPQQWANQMAAGLSAPSFTAQYSTNAKFNDFDPWPPPKKEERQPSMIEKLMKMYVMSQATGVTSPMPHLFGPPGCGKSSMVQQLADLVGKKMYTINVSRISPLELEGVQMPNHDNSALNMLTATFWTGLQEGDILLLDEFLRGFPEVYNGMLDILTSRQVGDYALPKVFIIGASNSVVAYDPALEDRLLHLPVPDPRKKKREKQRIAKRLVNTLGLLPDMATSLEMEELMTKEILPTYDILDKLGKVGMTVQDSAMTGRSIRHLIGQAQLREVQSEALDTLIAFNNSEAMRAKKAQHVLLLDGVNPPAGYEDAAHRIKDNPKLTAVQKINIEMSIQLIEMEKSRHKKEDTTDDDIFPIAG